MRRFEDGSSRGEARHRRPRLLAALLVAGIVVAVLIALIVVSFVLDGFLRPRLEARMNAALKGYRVTLGHAHFQPIALRLTLRYLTIAQIAHPVPPVADFSMMRFRLQWTAVLHGHVVANVEIRRPRIHINQPQLLSEARSNTPLRQRGWQDALEAVYPFKINRMEINDGDVVYIDSEHSKPLHVTNARFVTDNIRNISEPKNLYPSTFSGSMDVFGAGRLRVNGRANYLMKPHPGLTADYAVQNVPLNEITPASQHVNVIVRGGLLTSEGSVEYSPKVTDVKVRDVRIYGADLTYVHLAQTQQTESRRIAKVGKKVQEENNRPATEIDLKALEISRSRLSFKNEDSDPPYLLFMEDANLAIDNFSNHAEHGESHLRMTGRFMGSGATDVVGTFVAAHRGPAFASKIAIQRTNLTSLNPLLRAEGRIDVSQGFLSVYSEVRVKNDRITGYVKPLFAEVQVSKEKNESLFQRAKQAVAGAAAHLLKNANTQKVATDVDLNGTLTSPNVSIWQAVVETLRNAFIKAILPGFDREIGHAGANQ